MQIDDLVLVSVDDHVVEPPDMFERPPAGQVARRRARRSSAGADGSDVWVYDGNEIPNIGLNAVAGRPPEEYGMEPTSFDEIRAGLLRHRRAGAGHGRQRRARLDVLPVVPASSAASCSPASTDHDAGLAMLQAYNDWHIDEWCGAAPGRFIPLHAPAHLGSRGDGRRGPAHRGEGLPRRDVLGEPVAS